MIQTTINELNENSKEGKLLNAAISIISTDLYTDKTSEEILEIIQKLANEIYLSDEDKLKINIRTVVIDSFINKYYHKETGQPLKDASDLPEVVSNEINLKIESLLESLKSFGIFNVNNI